MSSVKRESFHFTDLIQGGLESIELDPLPIGSFLESIQSPGAGDHEEKVVSGCDTLKIVPYALFPEGEYFDNTSGHRIDLIDLTHFIVVGE